MPKVDITYGERQSTVNAAEGQSLLDAIRLAGIPVSSPCGGGGRCGKCMVQVNGRLGPVGALEQKWLEDAPPSSRLACCAKVEGDCAVWLPKPAQAMIEAAYTPWHGILQPIYSKGYGAAFDIGTTTVAGQLFAHDLKRPLAVAGEMNAQQSYGADVIARCVYCDENTVKPLCALIKNQLSSMLKGMCVGAGITPQQISHISVTGNTVMLYILFGIEPGPLAIAPFTMNTGFGGEYDLGLAGFEGVPCTVPRCVSAYIGADITCAVLASGIAKSGENVLLVDAGTNGEMALCSGGSLKCCSTAAGPAFEGAGIDCGGNASLGAIDTVAYRDRGFSYSTIGGAAADKLCGSGLIDAVAALLDAGMVDNTGRMDASHGGKVFIADTKVYISKKDVRQLQLAKAAIRAGMDTLIRECGLEYAEVERIVLCGGFGSYMKPASAERIGLLPPGFAAKTTAIGNAAGNGAGQILQSAEKREEAARIAEQMHVVELATNPFFMNRYVEAMSFQDIDEID